MRRIGIQGGTFDPIHFGHLRPALEVLEACALDEVRFIPCAQPVHRDMPQTDAQARLAMVAHAIASVPAFRLDDREIRRSGPSYMVDTLTSLKAEQPKAGFYLILGQDAFLKFETWYQWQKVLDLASLVVTQRPGYVVEVPEALRPYLYTGVLAQMPAQGAVGLLPVTQLAISSTQIRAEIDAGRSIAYLLPEAVIAYIKEHGLYQKR